MGILVMIAGQIYFWLPGDIVNTDWSKICFQGILVLYCPLRSACVVYTLCFALPYELDVVWLFFHFHFGGVKEQVDFSLLDYHLSLFYTEMSVFSFESCQCAGKCGFWNVHRLDNLDILTAYFV